MDMFELGTRKKLRFTTTKGQISIEDLWDLPITTKAAATSLDSLAVALDKQLSETGRTSFINPQKKDVVTQLKFDIVRQILVTKVAEKEHAADLKANKQKKERLLEILASKQDDKLKGMSESQIQAMIREL